MYEDIFGSKTRPYYIWAPRWIESSAGARCMHYLCHSLNAAGQKAYLYVQDPPRKGSARINGALQTPILSLEVINAHSMLGLNPIVVYPEDVHGNPLRGSAVVRILWMYAGKTGGPTDFKNEEIFAFSENIALDYQKKTGTKPRTIFVPHIDPREFSFQSEKRGFQLVYAGKYRTYVGDPPKVGNLPSIEILRAGPKKQSRSEVKRLLREASVVYSFDNSAIVTEAILSGTPASYIKNDFLGEIIPEKELGWFGTTLGDNEFDIEMARETLAEGRRKYLSVVESFPSKLQVFISTTQNFNAEFTGSRVQIPRSIFGFSKSRFRLAFQMLLDRGFGPVFREFVRFLKSK